MKPEFESIPKLGFGCMRLPLLDATDQTSIDVEQFKQMVDAFMEAGGTYFDTAFVYHEGASEKALKEALVQRYPRDAFTVATKCLAWAIDSKEEAQSNLTTSLERMGLDYVDFYLLHNVGGGRTAKFDEYGMWDFVKQKQEEGLIKNWGFSMHADADTLDALLTAHPDADFVQLQVNYLDWDDPVVQARACMDVAARHGVPVVIMEPARGGRLAELPESVAAPLVAADPDAPLVSWAYRFCMNLPNVLTVLSGMSTLEQARENAALLRESRPFSPDEQRALDEAVEVLRGLANIPCTNCRYCVKDCPQGVVIPEILALMNLELMTKNRDFVKGLYSWQAAPGPASKCIACGACEAMCPQSINIIQHLEEAAEHFE
ncbi:MULTISPECIES: aldo/keto reductase [Gordonibacter]|uniref:Aldo/keto reductase n=1 Tax=Gordonibacter faecis TaxID=3047475 RepID=A0ABT7DKX9_9ACTN|nr:MULTISPECIES: aldo/keto reductase [unclassified Gordonibacter]MDJ1650188.1 aldo/keto reductase [Gordonibacter sp. KGMB12511]HIW75978.1 aldo/keto reductase [Candidatus Gordonibacter avicola]